MNDREPMLVSGEGGEPVGLGAVPSSDEDLGAQVEQPQKVMRVGSMVKQLLQEVRDAPLDEPSRQRLREVHRTSVQELQQGLAPQLVEELDRLALPFEQEHTPSEAELRVAQAQLVGWLEGLFHGLQTALVAQQVSARAQRDQLRPAALPAGGEDVPAESGQYL